MTEFEKIKLIEMLNTFPVWHSTLKETWMPMAIERLAQHLLNEGAVISPVEVGQKVWYIKGAYYNSITPKPCEITVTEINKKKHGKDVCWGFIAGNTRYKFSSIGKSVFLSEQDCITAIERKKMRSRN
jgi:hypothetical protein